MPSGNSNYGPNMLPYSCKTKVSSDAQSAFLCQVQQFFKNYDIVTQHRFSSMIQSWNFPKMHSILRDLHNGWISLGLVRYNLLRRRLTVYYLPLEAQSMINSIFPCNRTFTKKYNFLEKTLYDSMKLIRWLLK